MWDSGVGIPLPQVDATSAEAVADTPNGRAALIMDGCRSHTLESSRLSRWAGEPFIVDICGAHGFLERNFFRSDSPDAKIYLWMDY